MTALHADMIGIPYVNRGRDPAVGLDCWGLLRHFYKSHFDIALPSYADEYEDADDRITTVAALNRHVDSVWRPVDVPLFGDGIRLKILGDPCHVAVYIGQGRMLHTQVGCDSAIDEVYGWRWENRIAGFYRHCARIGVADASA